jgi:hypothetical protein
LSFSHEKVELPALYRRLRQNAAAAICRTLYSGPLMKKLMFVNSGRAECEKMHPPVRPKTKKLPIEQENTD